jgi:hypothetical protein
MEEKTKRIALIVSVIICVIVLLGGSWESLLPIFQGRVEETGGNPNFTIAPDDVNNTLLVTSADPVVVSWENINITVQVTGAVANYSTINLTKWGASDSISYTSAGGVTHAPASWGFLIAGDMIHIGNYNKAINVSLKWIPLDKLIGFYSFFS